MLATQHLTKGQGAPPKGSKEQSKHRSHRGEERNYIGTVPLLDMHETFAKYLAQDLAQAAWCKRGTLLLRLCLELGC